jgi:hypothetical protein
MAKRKSKLRGQLLAFFQKIGAEGGKKRAKMYNAAQLSEWAKKGGRPRKPKESAPAA